MANIPYFLSAVVLCFCAGVGDAGEEPISSYLRLPRVRETEERLNAVRSHSVRDDNAGVLLYLSEAFDVVPEEYLSVTMDAGELRSHLQSVNFASPSVINTAKGLAPALFRVGGTDGDYALYATGRTANVINGAVNVTNYTVTLSEWDDMYSFTEKVGWHLIFGLNLKLRSPWPIGSWDSSNAIQLIDYSKKKGQNVSWELGNEPTLYNGPVFVDEEQLAKDFETFRQVVDKHSLSKFTIGPDCLVHDYLYKFLMLLKPGALNAITYHSYYTPGPMAKLQDLINGTLLDTFTAKAIDIALAAELSYPGAELWLGETGGLNKGGNPVYSPSYVAGFFWVQTLGVAALCNVKRVLRQDFLGAHYSLLTPDYVPTPNYWLSYVHKQVMGTKVVYVSDSLKPGHQLRVFAHCAKNGPAGSVALMMMNLNNHTTNFTLENQELASSPRLVYWLTPRNGNLTSTDVQLNGDVLQLNKEKDLPTLKPAQEAAKDLVVLPPLTYGFYVFTGAKASACMS